MLFWIVSLALMALVLSVMGLAVTRGGTTDSRASDLAVYRDQLTEIDRDLRRGTVDPAEAARLRTEVQRRLLDADRSQAANKPAADAPLAARRLLSVAGLMAGTAVVWAYLALGEPLYPDMSRADRIAASEALRAGRPSQAEMETAAGPPANAPGIDPEYLGQIEQLRTAVADRPDDLFGHSLLAQNEAAIGHFVAAARAQERVIALKGDTVTAADQAMLANLLILAAGGLVTAEAEAALTEALRRDPANGAARYYSGLLFAQIDRPDLAYRLWRPLYEQSGPGDPWTEPLRTQLDLAAVAAGVEYRVPVVKGPDAEAVADAAAMSADDRSAMIASMVKGLAARLQDQGGSAAEWAQLIRAYGVLGQADKASAAWAAARAALAAPDDLAMVRDAAAKAGVPEAGAAE